MAAIDAVAPYVEQLLDNEDVRESLGRATTRARQAYGGARRKGAKKAVGDRRVRARIAETAVAAREAMLAVKRGREEELRRAQRRARRRRLLVLLFVAGAAVVVVDEGVRKQLLGLVGATEASAPEGAPAPEPERSSEREGA